MSDAPLVRELLQRLLQAAETILERFGPIRSAEDFLASPAGREKLDAICMQLIAIGEGLKNLDKVTGGSMLPRYPGVDWRRAKGLRDVISHGYFDVDPEQIFLICRTHVPAMRNLLSRMLQEAP
ncbi:MAG: DUF86 domain-containing protein [Candidatus Lambdaproteobacteria bacterium]|nr:DUF86 domain-containing protein [Candidatus Lambdaproteobacteria bacterium]